MNKLPLVLLTSTFIASSSYADVPWEALTDMTASLCQTPVGNFSQRKVAVVDNGFDSKHVGLKTVFSEGYNGRDNSTDVNASIVHDKKHHEYGRQASHGTHVAGIVAQMNGHIDIVPVKRGSSGHRDGDSDENCLTSLIGRKDIEVINLSFGIYWDKMIGPLKQLAQEGKTIVIAAGNRNETIYDQYLASQKKMLSEVLKDLNGRVILIGATEKKSGAEKRAAFSNKPSALISPFFISAPGTNIKSYVPLDTNPSGIKECSGTSMAAPVFVGALMRLSTEFNVTIDEAREVLFKTAVKQRTFFSTPEMGQGAINFKAARDYLKKQRNPGKGPTIIQNLSQDYLPYIEKLATKGLNVAKTLAYSAAEMSKSLFSSLRSWLF